METQLSLHHNVNSLTHYCKDSISLAIVFDGNCIVTVIL